MTLGHQPQIPGIESNQALARGLYVLRRLVESQTPLSGSEIAREMGLNQSSISRVLSTLIEAGYVRKDPGGRFVPDYGVITLAAETTRMPMFHKPIPTLENLLTRHPTLTVTTAMLWRSELVYLVRSDIGGTLHTYEYTGYPLNASIPGLRLLMDLPEQDAIQLLEESRNRHGWGGNDAVVPKSALATLTTARRSFDGELLILKDWAQPDQLSGAIPITTPEPYPVVFAIVDHDNSLTRTSMKQLLRTTAHDLEEAFRQ